MERLIIVQWDTQLGPIPIIQYPPKEQFPPKELLLKIWARHEINPENPIAILTEENNYYCSFLKRYEVKTYFIIIELNSNDQEGIFQEILESVSQELLDNLEKPQFPHIISDVYKTIKQYTIANEEQIYTHIFEDKIRIAILSVLRQGCITKLKLKTELETKYGYKNINIDMFLAPFQRLGLITTKTVPGAEETVFLLKDFYCCRIPPTIEPTVPEIKNKILTLFETPQIISENEIKRLINLTSQHHVKKLFQSLTDSANKTISWKKALNIVGNDEKILELLIAEDFIMKDAGENIHLISILQFMLFSPYYLLSNLVKRYENNEISIEQLHTHIEFLKLIA